LRHGSEGKVRQELRAPAGESSVGEVKDGYAPIGVAWERIAATSVVQIGEAQLVAVSARRGNRVPCLYADAHGTSMRGAEQSIDPIVRTLPNGSEVCRRLS
jgi:hypothetical protein